MGIEIKANVVGAVNLQDNVLIVVFVVQLVVVGELLVPAVGTHILYQHGAVVLLVGNIVGINGGVVAVVEVPDEFILSLILSGLLLVGPPADNFCFQVIEDRQHIHAV